MRFPKKYEGTFGDRVLKHLHYKKDLTKCGDVEKNPGPNKQSKLKKNKNKNKKQNVETVVVKTLGGFGRREKCHLKLVFAFSGITTTASDNAVASQRFIINSLYDFSNSGSGSKQPPGFDTLAINYNNYRVFNLSILVEAAPLATAYMFAVIPTVGLLTINTAALLESANGQYKAQSKLIPAGGSSTKTIRMRVNLAMLYGATQKQYDSDDRFGAAVGANPTEAMSLYVVVQTLSATAITPDFRISADFHGEFYEDLPQINTFAVRTSRLLRLYFKSSISS